MRFTTIILLVANVLLAGAMLVVGALRPGHTGPRTEFAADRVHIVDDARPKPAVPVAPALPDVANPESGAALCLQWSGIPSGRAQEARDALAQALTGISFREKPGADGTVSLILDGVKHPAAKTLMHLKDQFPGSAVKATLCEDGPAQPATE
jgi:hypothetical protein